MGAERLRVEEELAAKQREEEELKRQIAEEAERKAELERQEAEEAKRRADEEARRNQEAAEAAERELKEAAEKAEQERAQKERAQKVQDWLKSNKFAGPNDKKSANCACASTYPIHEAATQGHVDIVRGLLEAKANANQTNNKKLTALQLAELKNHAEVVALLLGHRSA